MTWHTPNNPRAMRRESANRPVEKVVDWSVVSFVVLIVVAITLFAASYVRAHDDADWIRKHGYKNMVGELCCGVQDCAALNDGDVSVTSSGYRIKSLNETVPFEMTLPAPAEAGGRYWRCQWGGQRKCFFAPPGQT